MTEINEREAIEAMARAIAQHNLTDSPIWKPYIGDAKAALAASPYKKFYDGMQWRDFESAPKDGTLILGYRKICNKNTGEFYEITDITYSLKLQPTIVKWLRCTMQGTAEWSPTHWMPLPTPPQEEVLQINQQMQSYQK